MAHSKEGENLSEGEMLKMIKKIDRERSAYRSQFTDIRWGESEAFNLCINTTGKEIKDLIDPIVSYINVWFQNK